MNPDEEVSEIDDVTGVVHDVPADGEEVVQGPEDRPADDEDEVVEHREVDDTKPLKGHQETVVSRSIYNFKT